MIDKSVIEFLKESNAIEGVYDKASLDQALVAWEYLNKETSIDHGVVLKTHKLLMLNQPLHPDQKGYYRTIPVYIGGREALASHKIRARIEILYQNINTTPENWQNHHIEFEKIHPFVDGNGRTGRMLMNWERLKAELPILILKADERQKYYQWFR